MPRPFGDSPYAFTVPPSVEAVPAARDRVVHRAQRLGLILDEELTNDLRLLTGEVVANSVTHTQAACVVSVQWTGERLRVEVTDVDHNLVRPSQAEAMDESGRGLFLVDALATEWGSQPCTAGKKTWFELAVPPSSEGTTSVTASQHVDAASEESVPVTCAPARIEHQAA
ncbi:MULTISPECIES: ATP-binding protein [Streptomyces]|uniref:ATP-binding protein n=1 Tax=Streptomyces TaxID=1883 RepID=UPI00030E1F5D|nr:ATP-binding protein [Streptomyces sp. LBUM 1485]QTU57028.1 ATP-binding protein [Streptomyces sp. LBUM 1480]